MITIEQLVAPHTFAKFLAEVWQKEFFVAPGARERYEGLMSWGALSSLLQEHRLVPPRIRLFKDGTRIQSDAVQFRNPPYLLRGSELLKHLKQGATLIVDSVEQTNPELLAFAQGVQSSLRAPVNVNVYAAWGESNGFPVHFDKQDNLILQIAGRKHWRIWDSSAPTAAHTLQLPPYWEGVIDEGALLYIPKGWWHIATPLCEPSLHLTVSLVPLTLSDYLGWITEQLKGWPSLSNQLPVGVVTDGADHSLKGFLSELHQFCDPKRLDDFLLTEPWNTPGYAALNLPSLD